MPGALRNPGANWCHIDVNALPVTGQRVVCAGQGAPGGTRTPDRLLRRRSRLLLRPALRLVSSGKYVLPIGRELPSSPIPGTQHGSAGTSREDRWRIRPDAG